MLAEIIAVGSELANGAVVNTNSAWLARALQKYGLAVTHHTIVGDHTAYLRSTIKEAQARSQWIFITGGLGPTYDDITKECIAAELNRPLHLSASAMDHVEDFFRNRQKPMTANNRKQALIPQGGEVLENPAGLAPGIWLEEGTKTIILLPGPPHEMKATFETSVEPRLASLRQSVICTHSLHFYGIGEAELDNTLSDLMASSENPKVAPYAKGGEVELRLTAQGENPAAAEKLLAPLTLSIAQRFQDNYYGKDVGHLKNALAAALSESELTIAAAESCTGGLISKWLTDIPGSSKYYLGGICTYSETAKQHFLHVSPKTLATEGAVSADTAAQMAIGARREFQTDIAVATTGIAGPGGGSAKKPVGLAYIGLATADGVKTWRFQAGSLQCKSRDAVREAVAKEAFFRILKAL